MIAVSIDLCQNSIFEQLNTLTFFIELIYFSL